MASPHLTPKEVSLDLLLLDPNNPRFVEDLNEAESFRDEVVEDMQDRLLQRFRGSPGDKDEGTFFSIAGLIASMRNIGFVPIDRVVARRLDGSERYLVLEGNRRVSAAKALRREDRDQADPGKKLAPKLLASLERISILELETKGLSSADIDQQVGVILGLRHFGQVMEWSPLPKAVNIYKTYMSAAPANKGRTFPALADGHFKYQLGRARSTASRLSVKPAELKKAIRTYIAFRQLAEEFHPGPLPSHFSLIRELVTSNRLLSCGYLISDSTSFELSSESLEKLEKICQFGTRETIPKEQKILREPKSALRFARLVADSEGSESEAVRRLATKLRVEVEDGETPLDDALDALKLFKKNRAWAKTVNQLLTKQEAELDPADYTGKGNELMYLEALQKRLALFERVLGL